MKREFIICDVFARRRFEGNQLAVFRDGRGLTAEEMQVLAREIHFSETTFILSDKPNERGWPVRIFTPAREVPFAGHPTLGTAYVLWDRFLGRKADEVRLDLKAGVVPVAVEENGARLVMTQVPPVFGSTVEPEAAARVLGLSPGDIDIHYPVQEVSTGLSFLIVPVKTLAAARGIKLNLAEYYRLIDRLEAKAVLAFSEETVKPQCRLHVRVFCDYYDVPEDPATGSANGCLCAWLVRHRYLGGNEFAIQTEQGIEVNRPSLLYLQGQESDGHIRVRVGGGVVVSGKGEFEL
ncbi:MAG TPA: PhzF family phenazine biosynthesis protein [bacterium]|nr:PhzF family phenazine biosynthesis protein [bacterium]